jgi:high-affinity K+ transport system ATPase subunit B
VVSEITITITADEDDLREVVGYTVFPGTPATRVAAAIAAALPKPRIHPQPGDLLRVPLGQAFPADGLLVQGHTQADEALLTGESAAVPKPEGAAVVAGAPSMVRPALGLQDE